MILGIDVNPINPLILRTNWTVRGTQKNIHSKSASNATFKDVQRLMKHHC